MRARAAPRSPSSSSGSTSADSSSAIVSSSVSANPAVVAELARLTSCTSAMARLTASVRCASDATGRRSSPPQAMCRKRSSNVPIRAGEQRRAPPDQVALDAVDVTRFGTTSHGSRVETSEIALEEQRNLADMRRPDDERQTHRSIVVLASGALSYAARRFCAKSDELDPARRDRAATGTTPLRQVSTDFGRRPATSNGLAGHSGRAVVAEICLLRAAPRVGVIDPHHGAATLVDLCSSTCRKRGWSFGP